MNLRGPDPAICGERPIVRGHLAAVADDFLPKQCPGDAPLAADQVTVYVGAPGRADTAFVRSVLEARGVSEPLYDLGCGIEARLARLERECRLIDAYSGQTSLFWTLIAEEGLSLRCALTLGRVAALLQPTRVTLLWFAGQILPVGRLPSENHCKLTMAMAKAAVPAAVVNLCCLGWLIDSRKEFSEFARRFA